MVHITSVCLSVSLSSRSGSCRRRAQGGERSLGDSQETRRDQPAAGNAAPCRPTSGITLVSQTHVDILTLTAGKHRNTSVTPEFCFVIVTIDNIKRSSILLTDEGIEKINIGRNIVAASVVYFLSHFLSDFTVRLDQS